MSNTEINSQDYWESRFKTDWDIYNGREQTSFFVNLLLQNLPLWIRNEFVNLSVCDAGCAEGQGTFLFKRQFPKINVEGIDFSEAAINTARENYPELSFKRDDICDLSSSYDVIFCSNVLEHFKEPLELIKKMLEKTSKHLIIMVPFQEIERLREHLCTFYYNSFPLKINDFSISFFKEIDCRVIENSFWNGKQAVVIYTKNNYFPLNTYLDSLIQKFNDKKNTEILNEKIKALSKQVEVLSNWGSSLQSEIEKRDFTIIQQNKKLEEMSNWGLKLENDVKERDLIILDQNIKIQETSEWGLSLENALKQKEELKSNLNKFIKKIKLNRSK